MIKKFFLFSLILIFFIGAGCKTVSNNSNNIQQDNKKNDPSGSYESPNASLDIYQTDETHFTIEGTSFWENEQVTINEGFIQGDAKIKNNEGIYNKEGCEIKLSFEKEFLDAKENGKCSGAHTTFTGQYKKIGAESE